jgi:hypothetical protein
LTVGEPWAAPSKLTIDEREAANDIWILYRGPKDLEIAGTASSNQLIVNIEPISDKGK